MSCLEKVHYRIPTFRDYEQQCISVVGGSNSTLDAAVMVLQRNYEVNLIIREATPVAKANTLHRVNELVERVHISPEITKAKFSGGHISLTLTAG